jgi:predicted DNA-binding protein
MEYKDPSIKRRNLMPLPTPPASPPRQQNVLSVKFPAAIYNRIQADARDDDRTPSYILRKAVAEYYHRLDGKPIAAEKIRQCPRRGGAS